MIVFQNLTEFLRYDSSTDMIQIKYNGVWTDWRKAYMGQLVVFDEGFQSDYGFGNDCPYRTSYTFDGKPSISSGFIQIPTMTNNHTVGTYISPLIDFTNYEEIEITYNGGTKKTISLSGVTGSYYLLIGGYAYNGNNNLFVGYNASQSGDSQSATYCDVEYGSSTYNVSSIIVK